MVKVKSLKTKPAKADLDKLKLDLNNARFQHIEKKLSDNEMEKMIWGESGTKELYEQIKSAGELYEPLVINKQNIVIEGNRRLVCLRRLKIEVNEGKIDGIKKGAFDIIVCKLILPINSDVAIRLFLASIHIKGKLPWPPFNKAKEIHRLSKIDKVPQDELAKRLGTAKITLIKKIRSYEQTYEYGKKYSDDKEWHRKYTYFEELFKKRDLKEFIKRQDNVNKFAEWVHENKFKDVRDVRFLPEILKNKDALKIFEMHGFAEAFNFLENENPAIKSKEFRQMKKMIKLIRFFPRKEFLKTASDSRRREIIFELKKEIDALVSDINMFVKKK